MTVEKKGCGQSEQGDAQLSATETCDDVQAGVGVWWLAAVRAGWQKMVCLD